MAVVDEHWDQVGGGTAEVICVCCIVCYARWFTQVEVYVLYGLYMVGGGEGRCGCIQVLYIHDRAVHASLLLVRQPRPPRITRSLETAP